MTTPRKKLMLAMAATFAILLGATADGTHDKVQLWEGGPYWATTNIGAEKPEEYGYYFWWGDTVGYRRENNAWVASDDSTSNFSFAPGNAPTYGKNNATLLSDGYIDSAGNLVAAHDAATAHWGGGWRMPTDAEINALINNCTTTWITTNGVNGRLVTGKGAYADRSIFLPATGYGVGEPLNNPGSCGNYWSSTPHSGDSDRARFFYLASGDFYQNTFYRFYGQAVRPVCDSAVLAHLSFDDYGNGGINVLKATVGGDGIVRTTKANAVEGIGAVAPVTDAAILAGLPDGDRAVAIPLGTHIALPIPAALSSESGKPWSISMKVKFPSLGPWYSIFTMPAANTEDTMVYLTNSESPAIMLKQSGSSASGSGGFTAGQWETLLFLFDSDNTRVLLNGKQIFSKSYTLAGSRADCANAGGFILLSGDNDSDDSLMYWADVKVYDGIVDDTTDWEHYTITWRDEDGSLIDTTNVAVGAVPTHAIPEKPTTTSAYYYFSGWAEDVVPATCDATYTATYRERQQDEDGYYLLDSSWAWDDFAELVTTDPTVNGRMTADINLGDDQTHIGSIYESGTVYFKGIFDGQGHTLTVNYVGSDNQMVAPFDKIENATIKNLHVAGTIQATFAYLGVVGWAGGASIVSNVWMSAEIANSFGGWGHTGSIVGGISGNQSLTIVDCLFTGSLTCGTSYTGCFLGNNYKGNAEINNCLSVGTVNIGGNSVYSGTHNNCYFKQCSQSIDYATHVFEEQLADGTIATALQAGREEEVWVQSAELGHPALKTLGSKETITWLNDDGSQIDTTEVINSYVPVHANPTKVADAPYKWVFTGWSPELEPAVSNTTYTATFKKVADLDLVESDWTAEDGDEIEGTTVHKVTIPSGATVTINGVEVAGASGGGAVVPAPAFPSEGASEIVKFAQAEGGKWTITAFAEMSNESRGTDVTDSQIKVYAADSLEELKSVTTPTTGATVKETKSAVKATVEVPAPSGKTSQFFKVKFGE